ncbi:MAG TPA: 50S ribosomal protein L25 [Candidatus Obscuribacterales bacterium]
MVEKFKLQLAERATTKPRALRREGKIPATLYGPGEASVNVEVDTREFTKLPSAAYSHIVELQGISKGPVSALIRHVQRDYKNGNVLNIEFYRVAKDRKLTVTVPLKFMGSSPAVATGGLLQTNFDECEVECFPDDIPDYIPVDLNTITEIDHGIHFSELQVPKGVEILNPAEEVICRVVTPKAEVEEKPTAAAAEGAATPAEGAAPAAGAAAPAAAAAAGKEEKKK